MYKTSNKAIELGQLATVDTVDWSQVTNVPPVGTGSVTSVDMTVPTGFVVTGVPVTTAGVIAVGYGAGYQGYTSTEATKLSGVAAGATAGADWNVSLSNIPANITSWAGIAPSSKANDSSVVHIAGSESISGQKTFSMPIVSSTGTSSWILSNTGTGGLWKNSDSSISFVGNPATTLDNLAINTDRSLTYNGNQVWHAGNLAQPATLNTTQTFTADKTFSGNIGFGSATRQMVNLYALDYGIGVQSSTQYYRSGSRFSWFKGGVHSDTENDPGSGGAVNMSLDGSGNLSVVGQVACYSVAISGAGGAYFGGNGGGIQCNGNLYTVGVSNLLTADSSAWVRQPRIFVQATDPGAAAADGDLWFW